MFRIMTFKMIMIRQECVGATNFFTKAYVVYWVLTVDMVYIYLIMDDSFLHGSCRNSPCTCIGNVFTRVICLEGSE